MHHACSSLLTIHEKSRSRLQTASRRECVCEWCVCSVTWQPARTALTLSAIRLDATTKGDVHKQHRTLKPTLKGFLTGCCSSVSGKHVFDMTIQYCSAGAAPEAPDNRALNNSPDLSGHRATPPLILPDKTLTIWLTFLA